jgi:hypothetical protein
VSSAEFKAQRDADREQRGLIRKDYSEQKTIDPEDYEKDYVIYSRNYLNKIYSNTVPDSDEILDENDEVSLFEVKGGYEPFTLSVYAFDNLDGIRLDISDLEGNGGTISSDNLEIEIVEIMDKRWQYSFDEYYGKNPWYLSSFDSIDIEKDTSRQFWITVYVPDNVGEGLYNGIATLTGNNIQASEIDIELQVYDIALEDAEAYPYLKYSYLEDSLSEPKDLMLENLNQHGVYPSLVLTLNIDPDLNVNFNNLDLEMQKFRDYGLLKDRIMVTLPAQGNSAGAGIWRERCDGDFLSYDCQEFNTAYSQVLQIYKSYFESYGVTPIFRYWDEPGMKIINRRQTNYLNKLMQQVGFETYISYYPTCEIPLYGFKVDVNHYGEPKQGDWARYTLDIHSSDAPDNLDMIIGDTYPYVDNGNFYYAEAYVNDELLYRGSISGPAVQEADIELTSYTGMLNIVLNFYPSRTLGQTYGFDTIFSPKDPRWLDLDWTFETNDDTIYSSQITPYDSNLGPMDPYLDNRVYALTYVTDHEISKTMDAGDNFQFYTTYFATQPVISYNRFLNGLYASATGADGV